MKKEKTKQERKSRNITTNNIKDSWMGFCFLIIGIYLFKVGIDILNKFWQHSIYVSLVSIFFILLGIFMIYNEFCLVDMIE